MKKTGIYAGAFVVCMVVALVVGFAGAAVATPHSLGKTARNETSHGQGPGPVGDIIDKLEQQGVDVSAARTAIANGDMAALRSWLDAYREANPENQTGNENRPGPAKIIDKLEQQGVDVSTARTAIANGDMAALRSWLDAYREANPENQTGNENRPGPAKIIDKLERQGVDVSAARTAIANGDMAGLKTWLDEFRTSHGGEFCSNKTGGRAC
jgi:SOS response regulatory protein OraA/RecX